MIRGLVRGAFVALAIHGAAWGTVQITVYNHDLALVKDTRPLEYQTGRFELSFTDVASAIDPTSVSFRVLDHPDDIALLEQNYRFDLVSSDKVLQKYLDRTIQVVTRQDKMHEGALLAVDAVAVTLQMKDGGVRIINREQIADISMGQLPEGLITRPTLVWSLDSKVSGALDTEVRYLTGRIGWHAEYVATISSDETALDLGGWVSIDNKSGATYEDATVKLIAGDVNRVRDERRMRPEMAAVMMMKSGDAGFEEKAFFEYHLYTLQRPSTINDNEIKQLTLFEPATVKAKKVFTYKGATDARKVRVLMEFQNSEESGLGIPLPKGKIRVLKADTDGSLEFVGEDRIDHTPKDEKVRVFLGNAFDVVGERIMKAQRQITPRTTEEDYEIKLRNHKDVAVDVIVIEQFWGDWTVTSTSHTMNKKDATTAEWMIAVPSDGEIILTFTVRRSH